ncbi:MAG: AAA family ATPase [Dehalococcoidia bacterium]|jgi:vacuolar protein-sorting-associated protein 4|nr:AAA family ATPase [Dehalococcoidia bacterium]
MSDDYNPFGLDPDDATARAKAMASKAGRSDAATALELYRQALALLIPVLRSTRDPGIARLCKEYTKLAEAAAARPAPTAVSNKTGKPETPKENDMSGVAVTERPNVKWDSIAGLESAKEALKEAVEYPLNHPEMFTGARRPWSGILLFGVSGTGKTQLARAVATEAKVATFYNVSASALMSKWYGESEGRLANLFAIAKAHKPSVIFFDEIESLVPSRSGAAGRSEMYSGLLSEFLQQMNGLTPLTDGVVVIAATNTPWALDEAMLRRFEKRIHIGLPEAPARVSIVRTTLASVPHTTTEADYAAIAAQTDGYSGSDMATLAREAAYLPTRRLRASSVFVLNSATGKYRSAPSGTRGIPLGAVPSGMLEIPPVTMRDLTDALLTTKPTVSEAEIAKHVAWMHEHGQSG